MRVQLILLVRGRTVRETEWPEQVGEALGKREKEHYKNIFKSKKGSN